MKKLLLSFILLAAPGLANADTILGLYGGIGQWSLSMDGDVTYLGGPINLRELGIKDKVSTELWLNFEHPLPIVPNLRLMHSMIQVQETTAITRDFFFGTAHLTATSNVTTDLDFSHTDATLYYELLDNWLSLDLGVTARIIDGFMDVSSELDGQEGSAALKGVIPMLYLSAEIDLPFTGWNIGAFGNAASYQEDRFTDYAVKLGYQFELVPLVDIGANLGYRHLVLKTESLDDLAADATLSGVYAELQVHF
jgi:outer membrane protein